MENKKNFGEYLKQKRKEIGLTQKDFASKLFVTESAVSKWERGVSYPDISLVKDICQILNITEHELLTASEDVQTRTNEKLAHKYIKLIQKYRLVQYIIYGATLLICFICNLAVNHTLSWFFIVLASIAVCASITLIPTFLEQHKGIISLVAFASSLLLLLGICNIYSGGNWFLMAVISIIFGLFVIFLPMILKSMYIPEPWNNHKALLCLAIDSILLFLLIITSYAYSDKSWSLASGLGTAVYWLIIPWGMMLVIRYTKLNHWFKTSICIEIIGIILFLSNAIMTIIIDKRTTNLVYHIDLANWNEQTVNPNTLLLILLISTAAAFIFMIMGISKQNKLRGTKA